MEMRIILATILLHLTLGEGRSINHNVQLGPYFPPARPSVENLNALCCNSDSRPRYPKSCIPHSSHSYIRHAGHAVNRAEAWFSQCCQGGVAQGERQILCCVKQAWKTALSQFCTEEFSVMTHKAHECCELKGEDRWSCFEKSAPNPSYQALAGYIAPHVPLDMIFIWNTSKC